jgi:hypothetical protein
MRSATLLVRIPGNWIGTLCTSCDLSIKVMRCVPLNGGGGMSLLQIDGPPDQTGTAIAERIRSIEPNCRIAITPAGPGRFYGTVQTATCAVCSILADSGCFLESAISNSDGSIQWNVIAPNAASLRALVEKIKSLGCSVRVKKISKLTTAAELTHVQESVLRTAYQLGYFEIPRKINLDRLAKRLEISKATLNVILRRAQKKIIGSYMGETI